jgi:hypothetical protein
MQPIGGGHSSEVEKGFHVSTLTRYIDLAELTSEECLRSSVC